MSIAPNSVTRARSRSASSSTTAADRPPSSRITGRISAPQISEMRRPIAVDPVNATRSTPRCPTTYALASASAGTTLRTPGGSPASIAASATARVSSTVCGDGLRITVHPAASAGAYFCAARACGKFHSAIAATTPAGSRRMCVVPPNIPGLSAMQAACGPPRAKTPGQFGQWTGSRAAGSGCGPAQWTDAWSRVDHPGWLGAGRSTRRQPHPPARGGRHHRQIGQHPGQLPARIGANGELTKTGEFGGLPQTVNGDHASSDFSALDSPAGIDVG